MNESNDSNDSNESNEMLMEQVGTFLLRDSSDSRCLYALSIQTEAGPTSVRIHYVDGDFRLDASSSCVASNLPRFRSVLELVDFYVSKWRSCKERGQVYLAPHHCRNFQKKINIHNNLGSWVRLRVDPLLF